MTAPQLLINEAHEPVASILLAHGAGAPMDSDYMNTLTFCLNGQGISVARFEFPYMARRREEGRKFPPDRMPKLTDAFTQAFTLFRDKADTGLPLLIGGKSMGGRVASMLADEWQAEGWPLQGVCCFGYPFYPPGRTEQMRTVHLQTQQVPTLVLQGTRDPMGKPELIKPLALSSAVEVFWIESGDHDLKPLVKSGRVQQDLLQQAAERVAEFVR